MSALGAEEEVAEFLVREVTAHLPLTAGEERKRREALHALRGLVKLAITVVPASVWCGFGGIFTGRGEERLRHRHFIGSGAALVNRLVEEADARVVAGELLEVVTGGEGLRLLQHERRVHQEERLLWHRRLEALRRAHVRAGEVERAEHRREVLAVNVSVGCAPRGEGLRGQVHRQAAGREVELAGREQE